MIFLIYFYKKKTYTKLKIIHFNGTFHKIKTNNINNRAVNAFKSQISRMLIINEMQLTD